MALPLFVKQNSEIRGVSDHRALNRNTKRQHALILRMDEMFYCLGHAAVLSKLEQNAGFHMIRVWLEEVDKTAFKTKYGH